jgi:class 3 adenylate cyclase/tetratricopeptide (TPR) repeat protein
MMHTDARAALASYLPRALVRALASRESAQPFAIEERAVVLLADLSGFTELGESLARLGPAGAETLSNLLNDCFGEMTRVIDLWGGEVVRFAGDSAIALWTDLDPAGEPGAAYAAARAAVDLHEALARRTRATASRLTLHVGMSCGDVTLASIGGVEDRFEFVARGPAVERAGAALGLAAPGDVVVHQDTAALLRERATATATSNPEFRRLFTIDRSIHPAPHPAPALDPSRDAAYRQYVTRTVLTGLDTGHADWLAEFRRVSVLFVSLTGGQPAANALQSGFERVQRAVYRHDGSINQVVADEKGTTVLAVWGAATRSHEDDAVRAVRAALEIASALEGIGRAAPMGVTTGRVFSGRRGDVRHLEYAVIGAVVNLASRLMQASRGDVLCDDATVRAAAARIAFEPAPPVHAKGVAEPVDVHRALTVSATRSIEPRAIVGRTAERARLHARVDALNDAAVRHGGVVVIEGEAGIGKSRLTSDLLAHARAIGVPALAGLADPLEQTSPYYAWRGLFVRLLDLEGRTPEEQRGRLLDALAGARDALPRAPLLAPLFGLTLPETPQTEHLSGTARAEAARDVMVALIDARLGDAPCLIVLEDAHWLDSASWSLALNVARRLPRALLALVMRPADGTLPGDARELIGGTGVDRLVLTPLDPEGTLAIARERLGVVTLPSAVEALIQSRAEGHPLFTEQLAYALRDGGVIAVEDGECRLLIPPEALQALSLPNSLEGVVVSRLDRLPPSVQLTAKLASVIGRTFPVRVVEAVHPVPADRPHVREHLELLDRLAIAHAAPDALEPAYVFKHALIQDASYNLLSFAHRRQLHRDVASWYERESAGVSAAALAHHWTEADVPPKAVEYLERAGQQALLSGAQREAATHFGRALDLHERRREELSGVVDELRWARWKRDLAYVRMAIGDRPGSIEHYTDALARLGRRMPSSSAGWVRLMAEVTPRLMVYRSLPGRFVERDPARRARLTEMAEIADRLMFPYFFSGQMLPFLTVGLLAAALAERSQAVAQVPRAYSAIGTSLMRLGFRARFISWYARAREAARRNGRMHDLLAVIVAESFTYQSAAEWEAAEACAREAVRLADELGDPALIEDALTQVELVTLNTGRFAEHREAASRVLAIARGRFNRYHEAWGLYSVAHTDVVFGGAERAAEACEEAFRLLDGLGDRISEIITLGVMARGRLRAGRRDLALAAARRTTALIREWFTWGHPTLQGYAGATEVYLDALERADSPAERRALAAEATGACRDLHRLARAFPIAQAADRLYSARLHALTGRPARAHRTWARCIDVATRLGMPYERAQAHRDRARLGGRAGRDADADRHAAQQLFDRMGVSDEMQY